MTFGTGKAFKVVALLQGVTCPHGYASAVYCPKCYLAALDEVEEEDDVAKLKKTVSSLAATVDELTEWRTEQERFNDRVHDRMRVDG
jgi:hypothetical protein